MIRLAIIIPTRTKYLNERLSKIQYSFDKLIEQCGPKWKESKLSDVLSSFKMTCIDTKECINPSLKSTDRECRGHIFLCHHNLYKFYQCK